jgi:hypothetical protein
MKLFHFLIFDKNVEGTAPLESDPTYNTLLASGEKLKAFAITDTVSGSSPTLNIRLEESGDQIQWRNKAANGEIDALPLSTSAKTMATGYDDGSQPTNGFARLRIFLGGANPKAHVRVWVTGRGEHRMGGT